MTTQLNRVLVYQSVAEARSALQGLPSAYALVVSVEKTPELALQVVIPEVPPEAYASAYLSIILRKGASGEYVYWGVLPTAHLASPLHASLRRSDCVHPRRLTWKHCRSDGAGVPAYHNEAGGLRAPPTAYTLDHVRHLLHERRRMYEHVNASRGFGCEADSPVTLPIQPFSAGESGSGSRWYPSDDKARAWDALSYRLMAAAVALRDGLDKGVLPEAKRVRGKFLWAERRLALMRISWGPQSLCSLLPRSAQQADGTIGAPWEEHLALFRAHGLSSYGRLEAGLLCLPAALWVDTAMEQVARTCLRDIEHVGGAAAVDPAVREVLRETNEWLWSWDTREAVEAQPAVEPAASSPLRIQSIPDLEDLHRVMPGCMRDLSEVAFNPLVKAHLSFEERGVFYRFALANGVSEERLADALVSKFTGRSFPDGDSAYGRKTICGEVKTNKAFLAKARDFQGDGCRKMQQMGRCPFFKGENKLARVGCHQAMEGVVGRKCPDDWPQGTPLRVTQFMRANKRL